jgi:hypothetical protein
MEGTSTSAAETRRMRLLLSGGVLAGPLYISVGLGQALFREGFDMRRHALSILSNGPYGWIQVANFLVAGVLVIGAAYGLRLAWRGERAGSWGPILLCGYGIGLLGAGVFSADPAPGFPPGTPAGAGGSSTAGLLHFVFGGIGFYALIAACFVFAHRFWSRSHTRWAVLSSAMGVAFLASFGRIASGSTTPATIISFYIAVAAIWCWLSAVFLEAMSAAQLRHRAATRQWTMLAEQGVPER